MSRLKFGHLCRTSSSKARTQAIPSYNYKARADRNGKKSEAASSGRF